MSLTLERINTSAPRELVALLDGIYVESPWIADNAASRRPFHSAHLAVCAFQNLL